MTNTEASESHKSSPHPTKQRRTVIAGTILTLVVLALFIHKQCENYLEETINAVQAEFNERAKPKKRTPLLGPTRPGNAIDDYNAIQYMVLPDFSWRLQIPESMPKTDYPYDYFNKNNIFVIEKARFLTDAISVTAEYERFQGFGASNFAAAMPTPGELKSARAFFQKYAKSITRHLRSGVRRERLERKIVFGADFRERAYDSDALLAAAQLLVVEASLQSPQEAVQSVAVLLAFAADMAQLPLDSGESLSLSVKELAFNALELLLRKKLSARDCKFLLKTLQGAPRMEAETLLFAKDCDVAVNFAQIAELAGTQKVKAPHFLELKWGAFGQTKVSLAFACLTYSSISGQQRQIFKHSAPHALKDYAALHKDPILKFSALYSDHFINENLFCQPLMINTHQDLLELALAARLFQLEKSAWPGNTTALQPYLKSPIPRDRFSKGQKHYILTKYGTDLVLAAASPPRSFYLFPLSVRIRAPAK